MKVWKDFFEAVWPIAFCLGLAIGGLAIMWACTSPTVIEGTCVSCGKETAMYWDHNLDIMRTRVYNVCLVQTDTEVHKIKGVPLEVGVRYRLWMKWGQTKVLWVYEKEEIDE